ncbi:hypothetical protein SAMN05428988_6490 [Chitinophaga sp. YR573]|nr:hypothetical protein SAMN05428988_6490 [Chitinophaga sp. YR573]
MIPSTLVPPLTWYQKMQMDNPVHYDPDFSFYYGTGETWQIFCYKDARCVLTDYEI